ETCFVSLRHQQRGRTIPTRLEHVNTNPTKNRQQVDKRLICKAANTKENRAKPRETISPPRPATPQHQRKHRQNPA
ncbi:hypothetical protein, partial [Chitinibacter tainanensis]|uniref:hypothetical protein n=1 Tax=Chitinibacter tainanensis TaxID=230667 RepID=UPI0023563F65